MDARHHTAWLRSRPSTGNDSGIPICQRVSLALGITLLLSGCRSGLNMDLLQQELRLYEDRVYELEYQLEDCKQENTKLQQQLDERKKPLKPSSTESRRGGLFQSPQSRVAPDPDIDTSEPEIEEENGILNLNGPTSHPTEQPVENPLPPTPLEETKTDTTPSAPEELPSPVVRNPTDRGHAFIGLSRPLTEVGPVDRIVLHHLLSITQHPTSEQIVLEAVVEPRDVNGRPVRAEGEISLMIFDPRRPTTAGKIARWTYTLSNTNIDWRHSGLGSGMHVTLPLDPSLADATYELWARLVTPNHQKHLANVEFELNRASLMPQTAQAPVLNEDPSPDSSITMPSNPEESQIPDREFSVMVRPPDRAAAMSKGSQAPTHKPKPRQRRLLPNRKSRPNSADQLTEAPKWMPPDLSSDPSTSQPLRQASRPQWSPYR